MKRVVVAATILCITIILFGQATAQTYGTKVKAIDPDMGLPLSEFGPVGTGVGTINPPNPPGQASAWVAYWDIGANPGIYDDKDVAYLQFGSFFSGGNKVVMANNIRLTKWGIYPAGSYVKDGDSDIGQQVIPLPGLLPSGPATGFYYMDVAGSGGYDLEDPVYLKLISPPALITQTNDIRITANAGFLPGTRVSNNDPDSGKPLSPLKTPVGTGPFGGPMSATGTGPVAQLAFFNANGNVDSAGNAIYDEGDTVYLEVRPLFVVSPNDIRLF